MDILNIILIGFCLLEIRKYNEHGKLIDEAIEKRLAEL